MAKKQQRYLEHVLPDVLPMLVNQNISIITKDNQVYNVVLKKIVDGRLHVLDHARIKHQLIFSEIKEIIVDKVA